MSDLRDVVLEIDKYIKQILDCFKYVGIIESFIFSLKLSGASSDSQVLVLVLLEFKNLLFQFLNKVQTQSKNFLLKGSCKQAEIRNIITKLVKNKCRDEVKNTSPISNFDFLDANNEFISNTSFSPEVPSSINNESSLDEQEQFNVNDSDNGIDEENENVLDSFESKNSCLRESKDVINCTDVGQEDEGVLQVTCLECELCKKKFAYRSKLKNHFYKEHAKQEVTTEKKETDDKTTSEVSDNKSQTGILQSADYACKECNKTFSYLRSLRYHIKLKHTSCQTVYECTICGNKFEEKKRLTRHERTHSEFKFECSTCGKKFPRSDQLRRHVTIVHEKKKDFSCRFCGKVFSLKANKDVHEQFNHADDTTSIQCEVCGKTFKNKLTFKSHLDIHSSKRLSCTLCVKTFVRRICYKNHMKKKHPTYSPFQSLLDSVLRDEG